MSTKPMQSTLGLILAFVLIWALMVVLLTLACIGVELWHKSTQLGIVYWAAYTALLVMAIGTLNATRRN